MKLTFRPQNHVLQLRARGPDKANNVRIHQQLRRNNKFLSAHQVNSF